MNYSRLQVILLDAARAFSNIMTHPSFNNCVPICCKLLFVLLLSGKSQGVMSYYIRHNKFVGLKSYMTRAHHSFTISIKQYVAKAHQYRYVVLSILLLYDCIILTNFSLIDRWRILNKLILQVNFKKL